MNRRGLSRAAAWGGCALCLVGIAASVAVSVWTGRVSNIVWHLAPAPFAPIGALVAARRPAHPIGWLLLAGAVGATLMSTSGEYAVVALQFAPDRLPGGLTAAWVSHWSWAPTVGIVPLLFWLFPDGRLPSRRWRPALWLLAGGVVALAVGDAFAPGLLWLGAVRGPNPYGVANAAGFLETLYLVGLLIWGLALLLAPVALAGRYRRGDALQRQQLKWVVAVGSISLVVIAGWALAYGLAPEFMSQFDDIVGYVLVPAFAALPLSIAVAVLRYRLYDIDRIISRTLAYVLLTAVLVGVYVSVVLLLARVVGRGSDLAVAGATLAAAALFRPLRRRVQEVVDRRFNRARYDAQRILQQFASRLRDEVDLDELHMELVGVVNETVAPASASLWLSPITRAQR